MTAVSTAGAMSPPFVSMGMTAISAGAMSPPFVSMGMTAISAGDLVLWFLAKHKRKWVIVPVVVDSFTSSSGGER